VGRWYRVSAQVDAPGAPYGASINLM